MYHKEPYDTTKSFIIEKHSLCNMVNGLLTKNVKEDSFVYEIKENKIYETKTHCQLKNGQWLNNNCIYNSSNSSSSSSNNSSESNREYYIDWIIL